MATEIMAVRTNLGRARGKRKLAPISSSCDDGCCFLFVCYYDESGRASFHGSRTRSVAAARTARGEGKGRESPISGRLSQPSSDRHRSGAPSFCRLTDQGCVARRGSTNPGDCGSFGALGKRQRGGSGHCVSLMTGSHRSAPLARRPGHLPLSARGLVAM